PARPPSVPPSFFSPTSSLDPRSLHSFPTRRSSDLLFTSQIYFFNYVVNRYEVLYKKSNIPAIVYLMLYACVPEFLMLSPFLILKDRKSTRLNSSHVKISYAVFCLKKKKDADEWYEL